MNRSKIKEKIHWVIIYLIIVGNIVLLLVVKGKIVGDIPLENIPIKKPTLVIVMDEFECANCIHNLLFLNDLASSKYSESIDFAILILSKTKTDQKNIGKAFAFPVYVSDDFRILKRLNIDQTPLIIGISKERKIFYADLVPVGTTLTEDYFKKGVIDRLYYSLSQ